MITRLGNRAFARITDILGINTPQFVDQLDIAPVSPVLDAFPFARDELVDVWTFQREIEHAGADSTLARISPYVASDWTSIFARNEEVTGTAPDPDLQVLCFQAGAVAADGNLTSLLIDTRPSQGSLTGISIQTLLYGDTTVAEHVVRDGAPLLVQPLPWSSNWTWWVRFETTGVSDLRLTLTCLVGPPGILSEYGLGLGS